MSAKNKEPNFLNILCDDKTPLVHRCELFRVYSGELTDQQIAEILTRLRSSQGDLAVQQKLAELNALIHELENGPLRTATFISLEEPGAAAGPQCGLFVLEEGTPTCSVFPDPGLAASLRRGDRVLVDGRGKAALRRASFALNTGEEAVLERSLANGYVEVSIHDRERIVLLTSAALEARIQSGEVAPGATLLLNIRQKIAFDALPQAESRARYRFLCTQPVPDVVVERDIGSPPKVIFDIARIIRQEMTFPKIRRRFGLRRCFTYLFTGKPGTGKTLAIEAIWRRIYETMHEVTGVPLDELPARVFRLRAGDILSKWFGEADKNIDAFFDEVEECAATRWIAPDGTAYELPVLVIFEEIDGLGRTRGQETLYDRVLTGMLQRLDPNRASLKDKLVMFIATTNDSDKVDSAMLRRVGRRTITFRGLDRKGFAAVLSKHIANIPLVHNGAKDPRQAIVSDLSSWLFAPNGSDPGVVELTYAGATQPVVRYRRDFLTGALIDRAVQDAAETTAEEAENDETVTGLRLDHLLGALDRQIRETADHLSEQNAHKILDVPDGVRIATVRRLPQPVFYPLHLQSN